MARPDPWDDFFGSIHFPINARMFTQPAGGFNIAVFGLILLGFLLYAIFWAPIDTSSDSVSKPDSFGKVTSSNQGQTTQAKSGRTDTRSPSSKQSTAHSLDKAPPVPDVETCRVTRCVDGDTIIVLSHDYQVRVRFIGCNTPETVREHTPVEPFGPEASDYTKKRIAEFDNKVTLVADGDRTDQYGRRLALVYLGNDRSVLLNEELIRLGLARADLMYHYSTEIKERYRHAQELARSENRGIWSLPPAESATPANK